MQKEEWNSCYQVNCANAKLISIRRSCHLHARNRPHTPKWLVCLVPVGLRFHSVFRFEFQYKHGKIKMKNCPTREEKSVVGPQILGLPLGLYMNILPLYNDKHLVQNQTCNVSGCVLLSRTVGLNCSLNPELWHMGLALRMLTPCSRHMRASCSAHIWEYSVISCSVLTVCTIFCSHRNTVV